MDSPTKPACSDSSDSDRFTQLERLINQRFDSLEQSNQNINDLLKIQKIKDATLVQENRRLYQKVRTLEDRLLKLERQVNNTEQNNRKNNVEVEGIPSTIPDEQLRFVVAEIFNHIADSDITYNDIETAHRLYSQTDPKPTIVRLKRNLIEELKTKEAKEKLKGVAPKMNFLKGTKLFINDNQSPNMRALAYNARLLKRQKVIAETWFSNAAVRIKRTADSKTLKITHEKDLVDEFPNFEFSFDMEFYRGLKDDEDIERYDNLLEFDSDDLSNHTDDLQATATETGAVVDPDVEGLNAATLALEIPPSESVTSESAGKGFKMVVPKNTKRTRSANKTTA